MEINIVCICFLLSKDSKKINNNQNPPTIYFLVQAIASIVFIINCSIEVECFHHIKEALILITILIKIGAWPIHVWYLKLIEILSPASLSTTLVITWQKIIPCVIIATTIKNNTWVITLIIPSCIIIPLIVLNKKIQLISIIGLSSIFYNTWFILARILSISLLLTFVIIYISSLYLTLKEIFTLKTKEIATKKEFWLSLLVLINLRGLPPSPLFSLKVIVLKALILLRIPKILLMLIILIASIFIYHYLWATLNTLRRVKDKNQLKTPLAKRISSPAIFSLLILSTPFLLTIFLGFPKGFYLDRIKIYKPNKIEKSVKHIKIWI